MAVTKNLFDGTGGSDGSANGASRGLALHAIDSQEVTVLNGPASISIAVGGQFDGATVQLQKLYGGDWITLADASWTDARELQDLTMKSGTAYRLILSGAGAGTNVKAWGAY